MVPTPRDESKTSDTTGGCERALRVLLAEDSLVNQRMVVGFLERAGHHVTVAANGQVALAHWEQTPFDVILMDVHMPVLDGLAATELIRQRERESSEHIPIIALTASAGPEDMVRCLAAGMDTFVTKPVDAQALFVALAAQTQHPAHDEVANADNPPPSLPLTTEIVDFEEALKLVPGGVHVLRELAEIFLVECPKLVNDLRKGLADSNAEAAHRAAHTLKGAARILAARRLAEVAGDIERLAGKHQLVEVQSRVGELEAIVTQTCSVVKDWRS